MLDFDHPDAIDMPLFTKVSTLEINECHSKFTFTQCLSELKACKQSNIPVYSFAEHQRLEETKYLYGATIIISWSVFWLVVSRCKRIVNSGGHHGSTQSGTPSVI